MSAPLPGLIMGFGTFDLLHEGHVFYLRELKKLAQKLIIVIARDQSVKRLKGQTPHFNEHQRLEAVQRLKVADEVILGSLTDFHEVIRRHDPDLLGFGYDQKANVEKLRHDFPHLQMIRIKSHHPDKYKSSLLKQAKHDDQR